MTPEEAYQEALRRIHEAEETGAVELDLSGWNQTIGEYSGLERLNRLPPELERLISLHSLDLSYCKQLSGDLAPLSSLTSLQTLDLGQCEHIRDLAPLAKLTSLQSLNLHRCDDLCCDLSPLAGLTSLKSLDLSGCDQLRGDLTPLTNLASLQSLNLGWSDQLTGDLSPLAGLTSLHGSTSPGPIRSLLFFQVLSAQRPFPAGRPHLASMAQPLRLRDQRQPVSFGKHQITIPLLPTALLLEFFLNPPDTRLF